MNAMIATIMSNAAIPPTTPPITEIGVGVTEIGVGELDESTQV
jgi:hypothetical protein